MRKLLSILLVITMFLALSACDAKKDPAEGKVTITTTPAPEETPDVVPEENEEKPVPSEKPADKVSKPDVKPTEEPKAESSEEPAPVPSEAPEENLTLGATLLADFKNKASAGMDVLSIAEGLMANEVIQFMGGAMPIEEGLLSGFDNTEIKGFSSGAVFMPMIGSIPFIGYVFELPADMDAGAFISTLRESANLRWNICVAADEMVTGAVGNKVFFVMCPTSLGE